MTRRPSLAALVGVLLLLGFAGCGSIGREDPILRLSAAEALAEGKRLFELEKFAAARPYFAHAFEVEPNSAAGREALLLVADSLFLQGGEAEFIQAEAKYRDFQNRFPTSDQGAYVQFQIANSLARRIERADRDQSATEKALVAYEDLLRLYPTSQYAEKTKTEIAVVRDRLAEHEFVVGLFYLRYGLPLSSVTRLENLLADFPDYSQRDKALYYLGMAFRTSAKADDAQATFSRLLAEFPQSEWTRKIPDENR